MYIFKEMIMSTQILKTEPQNLKVDIRFSGIKNKFY